MRFRKDDSDVKSSFKMRSFHETDYINKLVANMRLSTENQDPEIFATGSRADDPLIFGFTAPQIYGAWL